MQTNPEYRMVFICFVYIILFVYMENVLKPCDRLKPNSAVNVRPLTYQCVFTRYKLLEHDIYQRYYPGNETPLFRIKQYVVDRKRDSHIRHKKTTIGRFGINRYAVFQNAIETLILLFSTRFSYYKRSQTKTDSFIIFGSLSNMK